MLAVVPASAGAARIELRDGGGGRELLYTAGAGEVNSPNLQRSQGSWYLQDSEGPPIEAVPPCEPQSGPGLGTKARCPDNDVARAVIDLGDRDDAGYIDGNTMLFVPLTVLGGEGADRIATHSRKRNILDGGPGDDTIQSGGEPQFEGTEDTVIGGDGDDEIRVRDDARDSVSCGTGVDRVVADALDQIDADCETVDQPPPPPPPPPPGDPWKRADGKPIGVSVNAGARFTRSRQVVLTVLAPDPATALEVSTDGGFASFVTMAREADENYGFRLLSAGSGGWAQAVYVRFRGPGLDNSRSYSDDIIVDSTAPSVSSAKLKQRMLRLRARDAVSGVADVQVARDRRQPRRFVAFRSLLRVGKLTRWVRVRDRAGNLSPWKRVRTV